jgi:thermitase
VYVADERLHVSTGELVVGLAGRVRTELGLAERLKCKVVRRVWRSGPYFVVRPTNETRKALLDRLRARDDVRSVSPDDASAVGGRTFSLADQWQWHNVGGQVVGAPYVNFVGADVGAPWAWTHATGRGVRIGIIDRGFSRTNPAIRDALVAETAAFGLDGVLRVGVDAPQEHEHGAACLAMAAARPTPRDDGVGLAKDAAVCGIGIPDLRPSLVAAAIVYAAQPNQLRLTRRRTGGVDVISASFGPCTGPYRPDRCVLDAIHFATKVGRGGRGTPFFWAISNDVKTSHADDLVAMHPSVVAVGQTDGQDLVFGSLRGSALDLVAPGRFVATTGLDEGGVLYLGGTSLATPVAAATAALVLQLRPDLQRRELESLLFMRCRKVGPDPYGLDADGIPRNDTYGHGRVDAASAVALAR